jgi:DNA-binding MarR family transcriptional regulator
MTEDEARIWNAWRHLRRSSAVRRLRQILLEDSDGAFLDVPQVEALELIVREGQLAMGDIARALKVDASTATRAVDKLHRRGLVKRARASANGRIMVVSSTPEAQRIVRLIAVNKRQAISQILESFDAAEREQLADLLERLADGLDRFVFLRE